MRVSKSQTIRVGNKLGVNFDVVSVQTLQKGINVEMEHGKRYKIVNVINDSITKAAKIALAHLIEFPDYYEELEKMERRLKKRWKGRPRESIFVEN